MSQITLIILVLAIGFSCTKSHPINSTRDGEDSGTDLKNLLTEPANTTYATNSTLTRKELNSTIQPERNDEGSAIRKIMASKKDENITGQSEINTSAKSQPINSTRDGEDSGTDLKNLLTEPANTTYATNSTLTRKELNSSIPPERNDEGSAIRKIMASKKDEIITGQSEINTIAKSQPINSTRDGEDSGTDLKNLLTEPANTTYATNSTLTRKELNSSIPPERNDEGSAIRKIMASKKDEIITGQSEINTIAKSQPINSTRDGEDSGTDLKNLLTELANTTYLTNSTLTRKELNSTIQPERNDEGSAIRKIMASKKDENITGQSEINTSAKSQPINSTRDGEDSGTDLKNLLTDPANTTYATNSTLTRKELNSTIQPERNDETSAIRKIMASRKDENVTGQSEFNISTNSNLNTTTHHEDAVVSPTEKVYVPNNASSAELNVSSTIQPKEADVTTSSANDIKKPAFPYCIILITFQIVTVGMIIYLVFRTMRKPCQSERAIPLNSFGFGNNSSYE
ncbi:Glc1.8 [Bracoviriform demolitoris]|uniref:Mucin-like protein Glc1.8b n=1 Tax=Microplitis demolitor bracovirus (isolate Webb) TaxID=654919 RepID=GL18B_MDBVW|nr:Glc1.8 [Bracoviriform demolitoris]Q4ZJY7.1 RecName: Full=Mucin-like protein Glc1.8b; Short=Glc1.8b; Flags: Precursor [Microplitis demolitor bracovirus (isolate Webb)]AAY24531.1 Glc1.8 [Bracoviriform demolitoris]